VEEILIEAEEEQSWLEQQDLFFHTPRRRPERGRRALALLQARLGEGSVLRAELLDSHLPESSFLWHPFDLQCLRPSSFVLQEQVTPEERVQLVRRIVPTAQTVAPGSRGSTLLGGPYAVSTRWWLESVEREYRYRELGDGSIEWAYREAGTGSWKVQGRVE
jgi:hypothetical protein